MKRLIIIIIRSADPPSSVTLQLQQTESACETQDHHLNNADAFITKCQLHVHQQPTVQSTAPSFNSADHDFKFPSPDRHPEIFVALLSTSGKNQNFTFKLGETDTS
jgi:hypothetical protein